MEVFEPLTRESWRGYQRSGFPEGSWAYEDGVFRTVAEAERVDLVSRQQYRDFVFELEWRVASGGNSGVLYRVSEAMSEASESGPEMQLLDDANHLDGRTPETSAGALYGLIAPRQTVLQPVARFNTARVVVRDNHVEHWLNGMLVVAYELHGATLAALVAGSKFRDLPGFARMERGHIALQHHGDAVWFRHLRIRPLPD
jgi:hypothetical protein